MDEQTELNILNTALEMLENNFYNIFEFCESDKNLLKENIDYFAIDAIVLCVYLREKQACPVTYDEMPNFQKKIIEKINKIFYGEFI